LLASDASRSLREHKRARHARLLRWLPRAAWFSTARADLWWGIPPRLMWLHPPQASVRGAPICAKPPGALPGTSLAVALVALGFGIDD